ncbi:MAG: hypothetical protein K1W35_11565 [Lachnospiraceae bacterium]|mgnify:CR=1 FL=1
MDFIYLILAICSIIILIAFPIINAAKKRNQANMHLFDNMPDDMEQNKKQSNSFAMESAVVVAIVYLIMFFIEIIKEMVTISGGYLPIISITAVVSIIIIAIKWICRKKSVK